MCRKRFVFVLEYPPYKGQEFAKKEIQRFMDNGLDRLCNELKTEFEEYNKRRKLNGLHELKRMNLEFVQDVLNDKIKTR